MRKLETEDLWKIIAEAKNKPPVAFESRNFVGKFVSELNLRSFPFDHQYLRIVSFVNYLYLTNQSD